MRNKLLLTLSIILGLSSGCTWLGLSSEPGQQANASATGQSGPSIIDNAPTNVAVQKLERPKKGAADSVELVVAADQATTDALLIRYGYSKDLLDKEYKAKLSELPQTNAGNSGTAFKILLPNITPGESVFITVSGIGRGVTSSPSPVFEVK